MIWKIVIFVILFIGLAQSLEVDFDCPESVKLNEEFSCFVRIVEGEGIYDLKLEIKEGTKTITDLWNEEEESWKSGYYYLKEYISVSEEKDVRVRIESSGEWNGILKLRGKSIVEELDFSIEVREGDVQSSITDEGGSEDKEEDVQNDVGEKKIFYKEPLIEKVEAEELEPITLNSVEEKDVEENFEYIEKDSRFSTKDYIYLSISLILIIILFFWIRDKF